MDDQIKQLAETLKKTGIAASVYDAIEKAKSILNIKSHKPEFSEEKTQTVQENPEAMPPIDADLKKDETTLNQLMKEVNVSPEEIESKEEERIEPIPEDVNKLNEVNKLSEENPEKIEQSTEDIVIIKEEVDNLVDIQSENTQEGESKTDDMFNEEKKIDLSKIFMNKK